MTKLSTKTNALPDVNEHTYDKGIFSVRLYAQEYKGTKKLAKDDLEYLAVSVASSAINTRDIDGAEKFANAILAACKKARKLNKERGVV